MGLEVSSGGPSSPNVRSWPELTWERRGGIRVLTQVGHYRSAAIALRYSVQPSARNEHSILKVRNRTWQFFLAAIPMMLLLLFDSGFIEVEKVPGD